MATFEELLDTAIANADSRDQLAASRARALGAGDEARRHVVATSTTVPSSGSCTILTLELGQRALDEDRSDAEALPGRGTRERGAGDGIALLSTRTTVWLDGQALQGDAAATALAGADTAILRVSLAPQGRWSGDEHGDMVATFIARRITITD